MYNEFDAFGELFSQYNTYANKQAQMVRSQFHS